MVLRKLEKHHNFQKDNLLSNSKVYTFEFFVYGYTDPEPKSKPSLEIKRGFDFVVARSLLANWSLKLHVDT